MTAMIPSKIYYPSGDGQPVAETFDHLYVILITIEVLRLYLQDVQACVLGNQFLYYEEGNSGKRCAPDVMVSFGVKPGSRDNYKIWEESSIPSVVFEMTSRGTKENDDVDKKKLYAQIGIEEYWQFDPKGEWIKEQLRGFRLINGKYIPIVNSTSTALGLRLEVTGALISFYRSDNGEKLLIPAELQEKAEQEQEKLKLEQARSQELEMRLEAQSEEFRSQAEALQAQLDRYRDRFGEL
jgi:Uma2 family endonuclease